MAGWDDTFDEVLRAHLPWLRPGAVLGGDLVLSSFGLDSMGSVGLLALLEDTYGVRLIDESLQLADYGTPAAIWRAIQARRGPQPVARIEFLAQQAASLYPDRPAISDGRQTWTFAELDLMSRRAAGWLQHRGVQAGDRVLLRMQGDNDFAAFMLGALRLGAVVVPVSPQTGELHWRWIQEDSRPAVVVVSAAQGHEFRAADPSFTHSDALGGNDLGLLMYTSGSTGMPKAVACRHAEVLFAVEAINSRLGYTPRDVVFCRIPVSFDYGLYQLLLGLAGGAHVVVRPDLSAPATLQVVRSSGATIVPLVPTLAEILVQLAGRDPGPCRLRMFTNTGAALSPATAKRLRQGFPGAAIVPMYGMTECKRITIADPDEDLAHPGTVGRALPGTEVSVVDEHGTAVAPGEAGEVWVRGPHVMAGYWGVEEGDQERFGHDGPARVLRTGDYGWLDGDGRLYLSGRRDDMFKRRGVRLTTQEIEVAALDIPGVRGAAALPPGADGRLVLWVSGEVSAQEVIEGLAHRVDAARVPDRCVVLESLPLTVNGKVDKNALRQLVTS